MKKSKTVVAAFAGLPLLGSGAALAQDSPFTTNVAVVSDYAYRGISQTDERPALQGGFDYAHPGGFYAGVWGSNVSWLNDAETTSSSGNSLELDIYGGFKMPLGPLGLDVGVLQYYYPGDFDRAWRNDTGLDNPNTTEGYVGLSWSFLSFKYSYAFTDLFGLDDSDGSQYFDLAAAYEIGDGLTLNAHFGRQRIAGPVDSYNDWKLGVTKSLAGFNLGLHYVDTDERGDLAQERVVFSVSRSF
ncbi:MAG: TorF family putative porin [Aromatoleum sp.]|jgi:uncharacterized protein (TIGR02001 family)|uniref:TorF family putative porin n=1 Tax=Aromatoleum sp. TaxID=2307007 RepID=UPI0028950B7E|nr:TorF family putative porin [Aromatoleum sp.]MDT3672538.1 TorF family putative porin [Aromatoleum sp.]